MREGPAAKIRLEQRTKVLLFVKKNQKKQVVLRPEAQVPSLCTAGPLLDAKSKNYSVNNARLMLAGLVASSAHWPIRGTPLCWTHAGCQQLD